MLLFEEIFKNHFDNKNISDNNLQKFTEDNIQRIIANNGSGTYNTILADTNAVYTGYTGFISTEDIAFAVQQSLTMSVDILMDSFKDDASRCQKQVSFIYPETSPTYQEFFPLGLTEVRQANKGNIKTIMLRIAAAFSAHSADFDPAIVTLFANYPANYQAGRNAQLGKIGAVSTGKVNTAVTRDKVETQLMKNIFFVGYNNPGQVAQCMAFFNQAIIRSDINPDNDGKGQVKGLVRVGGIPTQGIEFELVGTGYNKWHSKPGGSFISPKVTPGNFVLRGKKTDGTTIDKNITINDAGIDSVDFDF